MSIGEELIRENDTEIRWKEHYVLLLNDDKISEVGFGRERIGGNEIIVRKVVKEEIMGALKKMKGRQRERKGGRG